MLGKLLTLVVFIIAVGAGLLGMRQYRLSLQHEMTNLHAQMNESRKAIWRRQVDIARRTEPEALRRAIKEVELQLEPITPATQPAAQPPGQNRDRPAASPDRENRPNDDE
jgi:hypothetical protein